MPVSEQLTVARRKQPYLLTSLQVGPRAVEQPSSISCRLKHLAPLQPPPASPPPHALAVYFTENLGGNLLTFPQAYLSVCFVSPCSSSKLPLSLCSGTGSYCLLHKDLFLHFCPFSSALVKSPSTVSLLVFEHAVFSVSSEGIRNKHETPHLEHESLSSYFLFLTSC